MKLPLLDLSVVSVTRYLSEAVLMARGFLLAWLLEPALFGVWTSMRLIILFSRFAHFGVRDGVIQRATYFDGREQHERASSYRRASVGFELCMSSVMAAVLAGGVLIFGAPSGERSWWVEIAVVLLLTNVFLAYQTSLRSKRRFNAFAGTMLAIAVLSTALGIPAAATYGLGGFVTAIGLSYVIVLLAGVKAAGTLPRPTLRRAETRDLLRTGFPIMAANAMAALLWNVDKLLIWIIAGSDRLGIYAVQSVFTTGVLLLPAVVHQVLHPHLMAHMGREDGQKLTRQYLERGTMLLGLVACPVVGTLYLLVHLPIRWLLPAYVESIAPGELIVMFTFFALVASAPCTVLVAMDRALTVIIVRAASALLAAVLITAVLLQERGFVAVAGGVSSGMVLYGVLAVGAAGRWTKLPAAHLGRLTIWLTLSYALMIGVVLGVNRLVPDDAGEWTSDLARTAFRCGILVAVLGPWGFIVGRRLGVHRPVV